jgi:hypothetical protein
MSVKCFGIRERRKIYEDAIYLLKQTEKTRSATMAIQQERAVQNLLKGQLDRCYSILITALGYVEKTRCDNVGNKEIVLLPLDGDQTASIKKNTFEKILSILPQDKQIKDLVWKAMVKRDKHAIEILNEKAGE